MDDKMNKSEEIQDMLAQLDAIQVAPEDVCKKELMDYLRAKCENGRVLEGQILFEDEADKENFKQLSLRCGVDMSDLICELFVFER